MYISEYTLCSCSLKPSGVVQNKYVQKAIKFKTKYIQLNSE